MNRIPKKIEKQFRRLRKGCLFENGVGLNETAMFIYDLCDGNNTEPSILEALKNKYEPTDDSHIATLQTDLTECLKMLADKEMIVYSESHK